MKRYLIAISAMLATLTAAATGTDSIGDILRQIAANNLTLKAQAHESEADVLDIKADNALGGPSVEYCPFFKKGYSGVVESELVVSQEFKFPTKYKDCSRLAGMQRNAGQQQLLKQRRDILLEAELICLDIIRLNQTLSMLNQSLTSSEQLRSMYEQRMEVGDANILELNKVKLDVMEVKALVTEARNERILLLQQLQQLNGGQAIEVNMTTMPEFAAITDYKSFEALALANDADIKTAEASLKTAEMDMKIQKSEWLPNLTVGYRRNTEEGEPVNGMMVGMSFPLYSNSKKIKAARERKQSAEIQVMQSRQEAEASIRSRYQQLKGLQQVLDHSDVKMMNESIALFAKALKQGEITALVYYEEINNIYQKLQRHIDLHCQSTKLLAELHKNEL